MSLSSLTVLYGGAFNPPHLGHKQAADDLLVKPFVTRLIILPSAANPLKTPEVHSSHRVKLCELTFSHQIEISREEIDFCEKHKTPSRTFETLERWSYHFSSLGFCIGTDQVLNWSSWYRFQELFESAHWLILQRKGFSEENAKKNLHVLGWREVTSTEWKSPRGLKRLQFVSTSAPALSSTQIRESIAKSGKIPPNSLTSDAETYLMKHRLYGTSKS